MRSMQQPAQVDSSFFPKPSVAIKPGAFRSEHGIDFAQNLEIVVARKEKVRSAKAVHIKEAQHIVQKQTSRTPRPSRCPSTSFNLSTNLDQREMLQHIPSAYNVLDPFGSTDHPVVAGIPTLFPGTASFINGLSAIIATWLKTVKSSTAKGTLYIMIIYPPM